jgi:hypothetical protein
MLTAIKRALEQSDGANEVRKRVPWIARMNPHIKDEVFLEKIAWVGLFAECSYSLGNTGLGQDESKEVVPKSSSESTTLSEIQITDASPKDSTTSHEAISTTSLKAGDSELEPEKYENTFILDREDETEKTFILDTPDGYEYEKTFILDALPDGYVYERTQEDHETRLRLDREHAIFMLKLARLRAAEAAAAPSSKKVLPRENLNALGLTESAGRLTLEELRAPLMPLENAQEWAEWEASVRVIDERARTKAQATSTTGSAYNAAIPAWQELAEKGSKLGQLMHLRGGKIITGEQARQGTYSVERQLALSESGVGTAVPGPGRKY